jgi:UrcA family protein
MKTIALAAVLAASLFAAPALAQTDARTRIVISPAGLDLTTADGRATLDLRVLHAARTACGTPSSADAQGRSKAEACVADLRLAAAARASEMIAAAERQARTRLAGR